MTIYHYNATLTHKDRRTTSLDGIIEFNRSLIDDPTAYKDLKQEILNGHDYKKPEGSVMLINSLSVLPDSIPNGIEQTIPDYAESHIGKWCFLSHPLCFGKLIKAQEARPSGMRMLNGGIVPYCEYRLAMKDECEKHGLDY